MLRRLIRTLIRTERGQAMVETALVMPIVLLLLFGMLDAGRIFHAWIIVTNGAREGVRAASTQQDEATIEARIDASLGSIDGCNVGATTCTLTNVRGQSGEPVSVEVETIVTMVTPLISDIFGVDVPVSSTTTMMLE